MELFAASFKKDEAIRPTGKDGAQASAAGKAKKRSVPARDETRRRTVRVAVAAIAAALSVIAMFFGVAFGVLDLTALVVSSFLVTFCILEMGNSYPYLVWLVTSVLAFLLVPEKLVCFEYFLFAGVYPMLKFRVARLAAPVGWIVKLLSFNAALTACWAISTMVLGLDAEAGIAMTWALYPAGNAMFVLYDLALSSVSAFYILRLRRALRADRI